MALRPGVTVLALLLATLSAGCASRKCCYPDCGLCEPDGADVGQAGSRGTLAVDAGDLEAVEAAAFHFAEPDDGPPYRVLRAREVQCRAAASAPVADAVRVEMAMVGALSVRRTQAVSSLTNQVLLCREVELRNEAAAQALTAFYLLAEVEANRDLLRRSLQTIDAAIDDLDRLQAEGVAMPARSGRREWLAQRMALVDRWMESDLLRERLSGQLRRLLGVPYDDPQPLWPAADLNVSDEPIDVDEAIEIGLAERSDVVTLATLLRHADLQTLPVLEAALSRIEGTLGVPVSQASSGLLGRGKRVESVGYRRRQLQDLLCVQQQVAAEEIRQAVLAAESAARRVALAKESLDNRRLQLAQIGKAARTRPEVTAFDVKQVELQKIEAEQAQLHEAIAWRIAEVEVSRSIGMLAPECGFDLWTCRPGCEGTWDPAAEVVRLPKP